MSTFFTNPASQRKRKRDDGVGAPSSKKRSTNTGINAKTQKAKPPRTRRDESISSDGSEDEARHKRISDDGNGSVSEDADETNAERRLRLAEQYLQNIKGEVEEGVGFDAEDIDRDLIAERLEKDVAETKERLHKYIASTFDFARATRTQFRYTSLTTTSIAVCAPHAYTVSKDIRLIKWELPTPSPSPPKDALPPKRPPRPRRHRPTIIVATKGDRKRSSDNSYDHHTAPILCVAASTTGKFIATGGADKRLIIWSASDLKPLRVFTQHRDAITSLAFRQGTNQLYSASKDRTIKTWSLDELAYTETLFGHQDEVVDVAALSLERCISVGARDRTARLWKVVEETQLVFRGGGGRGGSNPDKKKPSKETPSRYYTEGSIDRVALVDSDTFVTGSDNGSLSLWSLQKKKPVFTVPLAHGLDPELKLEDVSADRVPDLNSITIPDQQPRWITALATVPLSDIVISGSWDGHVRVWQISKDKKRLERVGVVGGNDDPEQTARAVEGDIAMDSEDIAKTQQGSKIEGIINDLSVFERGERGKEGLTIVVAVGTDHRLGAWKRVKGRNGAVSFEIPRLQAARGSVEGGENES